MSACGAGRTDVAPFAALHTLPAVFAYQRHEPHRGDLRLLELVSTSREHVKRLLFPVTQWNKDAAALGQLLVIRRRNLGGAGTNEYRFVGRVLSPAKGS